MATTTRQPGDRIPMSWEDYEALGPQVRGEQTVHGPGAEVTLDVGTAEVTFDPGNLLS